MQRWIVLVGPMGCGKSAVGRAAAARLGARFADADEEVERAAGMSVAEIFARDGEASFRAREAEAIARLLAGPAGVLATGGGAWVSEANRRAIDARATSVWLDADLDTLWARVSGQRLGETRPLLACEDPRAALGRIAAERAPLYALARARVRSGPDLSVDEVADGVIEAAHEAEAEVARAHDARRAAS